jgi:outer membrane protein assembly factor BamB
VGTPAVTKDGVFVANDLQVLCLDRATGERRWAFGMRPGSNTDLGPNQSLRTGTTPLVVGDHVVVGSDDGYVYVVDLETGAKQWAYNTGTPIKASPVACGETVVVTNFAGNVFGFRMR